MDIKLHVCTKLVTNEVLWQFLLSILTAFSRLIKHSNFIWCVCIVKLHLCIKGIAWSMEEKHLKIVLFPLRYTADQSLKSIIFNQYVLVQCEKHFGDNSSAEPTTLSTEKMSFSLKFLSGPFYGQSWIKTVWGPWYFAHSKVRSLLVLVPFSYFLWRLIT